MVREGGVEPPHQRYWNLNPARLPIPPPSHEIKIKEQPLLSTLLVKKICAKQRGANYAYAY